MTLPPDPGRPLDTSPEAHRVQGELYARMGPAARLSVAFDLSEAARRMALAGIRRRHPDYTDEQVWCAWARLTLGDDRCREAWPNRPLVDP
jgi:hypothetical protein